MKDFEGNEVKVGDTIVFVEQRYSNLKKGVTKKINAHSVSLESGGHRFPKQFIKIN